MFVEFLSLFVSEEGARISEVHAEMVSIAQSWRQGDLKAWRCLVVLGGSWWCLVLAVLGFGAPPDRNVLEETLVRVQRTPL